MKKVEGPMITYEMIKGMTNSTYFQRGEEYQNCGMVKKGWIIVNGIKAKVKGSYKPYYLVSIFLSDNMRLRGSCTCPVGFRCKHCVAACLESLYKPRTFEIVQSLETQSKKRQEEFGEEIKIPEEYALNACLQS